MMTIAEINSKLKFKVAFCPDQGNPIRLIQAGESGESGKSGKWLKVSFKNSPGRTYLFERGGVSKKAVDDAVNFAGGNLNAVQNRLGKVILESDRGGRLKVSVKALPGSISLTEAKCAKFFDSLDEFNPDFVNSVFDAYGDASFISDFTEPTDEDGEPVDSIKAGAGGTAAAFYSAGEYDKKSGSDVWLRAISPLMWYGELISDDSQDLDSPTVPFPDIQTEEQAETSV